MKIKFLDGTEREVPNLYKANLHGANLHGAKLRGVNLHGANLSGANLSGAHLRGATLSGANLRGANLSGAHLSGANLHGANLHGANLHGANLSGANLRGANLESAEGLAQQAIIAHSGPLVGYKKLDNGVIAELHIPKDAKRVNAYGSRKCRASKAFVFSGNGPSQYDPYFMYAQGSWVSVPDFCDDPRVECMPGIHFFITQEEATECPRMSLTRSTCTHASAPSSPFAGAEKP